MGIAEHSVRIAGEHHYIINPHIGGPPPHLHTLESKANLLKRNPYGKYQGCLPVGELV